MDLQNFYLNICNLALWSISPNNIFADMHIFSELKNGGLRESLRSDFGEKKSEDK